MLSKSSKKKKTNTKPKFSRADFGAVIVILCWTVLSFVAANAIVYSLIKSLERTSLLSDMGQNVFVVLSSMMIFGITLLLLWFGALLSRRYPKKFAELSVTKNDLGWGGWLTWQQLLLGVAAYIAIMVASVFILGLVGQLFPDFQMDQAQDVGLTANIYNRSEMLAVFGLLVIFTPIVEELIFRGYLYGKFRQKMSVFWSVLVVSVLFGLAHGQWNVGVVTFVMSIGMCLCREATGSVYPAIIIHMIKNGLAFMLLFVAKA